MNLPAHQRFIQAAISCHNMLFWEVGLIALCEILRFGRGFFLIIWTLLQIPCVGLSRMKLASRAFVLETWTPNCSFVG
jgi:hypothetical protein